jgi:hypothetical protein
MKRAEFADRAFDACANLLPVRYVEFNSQGATSLGASAVLRLSGDGRDLIVEIGIDDIAAFSEKRVPD